MMDPKPSATIGVVDDDQRILESLETLLESADYAVRSFSSARALLENAHLAEIDCLISDIDMPVMDGFQLLRMLQATRPGLPIILITGHPKLLHQPPSIEPRRYRLLKKPFDGEELLSAVSDALQHR